MLRFGSTGDRVKTLQTVLNLMPTGAPLVPDGLFGIKTHGRVVKAQYAGGETPDGIVGWKTLALLKPYFDMLDHARSRVPSEYERQIREAIMQQARAYLAAWGWPNDAKTAPKPPQPNIAVRYFADEETRLRQGGVQLLHLFTIAGAKAEHRKQAMWISKGYSMKECDERHYADNRNSDLPSYCGIFALAMLRLAGLRLPDWSTTGSLAGLAPKMGEKPDKPMPLRLVSPSEVQPGDIGVIDPGVDNHHFIIVDKVQHQLITIDGNAGSFHSIIKKTYALKNYRSKNSNDVAFWGKVKNGVLLSAFPMAAAHLGK
ncbi:MAG: hypothetical protein AAF577_07465 [Pseudomonadota bacterium]